METNYDNVQLKPKVSLKRKQQAAFFAFDEKFKIEMSWATETDLDLCLFYKTADGKQGGVFSSEYNQNIDDLGSLEKFPYILHLGDEKEPKPGAESNEIIQVKNIDALTEIYVCVINYDAAIDQKNITFNEHNGKVEIITDKGDNIEVPVDDKEQGHVYLICKILNENGKRTAVNEGKVMSIGKAFRDIPGFKLICE